MVISDKPNVNSKLHVHAQIAAPAAFRLFPKRLRLQWHTFHSRNATMSIRVTKLCVLALFFLFLTNPFLRGVADDGKQS